MTSATSLPAPSVNHGLGTRFQNGTAKVPFLILATPLWNKVQFRFDAADHLLLKLPSDEGNPAPAIGRSACT
jgi:hypothetical protein